MAASGSRDGAGRSAIEIRGLVKRYAAGAPNAVDGIDLDVADRELFGLLGPNGAGKTTTVGVCTTRVEPTAGSARVDGIDVVRDPSRVKQRIGVVTQFNTLDRACTVWENLYFHCRFFGLAAAEARRRTGQLLEDFRLADRRDAQVTALSGGMAQRLQVARAIAHGPRVLFLDEPSAGLDPQSRIALWEIMLELRAREGLTILLTTHYMEEADRLCDRVAIIDHGRILAIDSPAALKRGIGAGTVVELHLAGEVDGLAERLRTLPAIEKVEPTADGLRLFAASAEGLLPRVVAAAGGGLSDVSVSEPTLETVFITMTGRDLRD